MKLGKQEEKVEDGLLTSRASTTTQKVILLIKMWQGKKKGVANLVSQKTNKPKKPNPQNPRMKVEGTQHDVTFFVEDDVYDKILDLIITHCM